MTLAIAVPFRGGALIGAAAEVPREGLLPEDPARLHTTVVKTPWGLLAGSATASSLDRVRRSLLQAGAVTVRDLSEDLRVLLPPDTGPCLLSYEPEEIAEADPRVRQELLDESRPRGSWLGSPVRLYRFDEETAWWLSWGALVPPCELPRDQAREGELRLQWGLDRGEDFDTRLEAVMATFAWFQERLPSLGREVDVGVHEPDHRYSVDRMAW